MLDYEHLLNHKDIWNLAQNKPTLIAKDLERFGVPRPVTHAILLARGVYKWLAVRRDLIKLKNEWRDELTGLYIKAQRRKGTPEHQRILGRIEALEMCRAQVRALCHSERFRAPDFDREANRFLAELEKDHVSPWPPPRCKNTGSEL